MGPNFSKIKNCSSNFQKLQIPLNFQKIQIGPRTLQNCKLISHNFQLQSPTFIFRNCRLAPNSVIYPYMTLVPLFVAYFFSLTFFIFSSHLRFFIKCKLNW